MSVFLGGKWKELQEENAALERQMKFLEEQNKEFHEKTVKTQWEFEKQEEQLKKAQQMLRDLFDEKCKEEQEKGINFCLHCRCRDAL